MNELTVFLILKIMSITGLTLSQSELSTTLELISECNTSHCNENKINNIFKRLSTIIPFNDYIILTLKVLKNEKIKIKKVNFSSLDKKWINFYKTNELYKIDPVLNYGSNTTLAYEWNDIINISDSKDSKKFIEWARSFKMHNGVSIIQKNHWIDNSCFFISLHCENQKISESHKRILEHVAPHIHSLCVKPRKNPHLDKLTSREVEVLRWVIDGKSSWDIGKILSISERTIKFHLSNIFRKLEVVNRSQAVATILKSGFFEAHSDSFQNS